MRATLFCGLVAASLLAACGTDEAEDEFGEESAADGEDGKGDGAAAFTFYEVYPDRRQCSFDSPPDCGGGYFVTRANRATIQCGRGLPQESCKVYDIDWTGTAMPDSVAKGYHDRLDLGEPMIIRGNVVPAPDDSSVSLAATEIWTSPTREHVDGVFALVKDNGIRCIQAPCPSLTERKLNSNLSAMITNLDFTDSTATQEQINRAHEELYGSDGLIVVGTRYYDSAGGKARTADRFFTRAPVPQF